MSSLDELLQTSPADLVANLKSLRAERVDVESKETLLEQLIAILAKQEGPVADEIAALGASAAIGPLRAQIVQLFRDQRPDGIYVLVPQEVHDGLLNRGNTRLKLDNVRQTMVRMVDSSELERPIANQLIFGLPGAVADMPPAVRDAVFGGQPQ